MIHTPGMMSFYTLVHTAATRARVRGTHGRSRGTTPTPSRSPAAA